jgi:YVTN family beta-propeller protein
MKESRLRGTVTASVGLLAFLLQGVACSDGGTTLEPGPGASAMPHTLYVAHNGVLASYDIATGGERPGTVENVKTPRAMQALDDGSLLINLQEANEVLAVEGREVRELKRNPSSSMGGTRPTDLYISPDHGGKQYSLTLNDGNSMAAETATAILVDITEGSPTRFQPMGETPLGLGHHQAAFSATRERFVSTSFYSCDNVVTVHDYSDPKNIEIVKMFTAAELGFDGSTMEKTCDAAESVGVAMRGHGCATSEVSGKIYCNLAGPGLLVAVDIDADAPTIKTIPTTGKGGGYVKSGKGGKYLYSVQNEPKEGAGGVSCQIGQLLTIDASADSIVHTMPILYKGPTCTDMLTGTDEASVGQNHIRVSVDGTKLFLALSTPSSDAMARVRQHVIVDISSPAAPVQLPSVQVGATNGQRGTAVTADGKFLFVADTVDNTVTQIDVETLAVVRTLPVKETPSQVATYGTVEGPNLQVGPVH